jgi:hypothetical protein
MIEHIYITSFIWIEHTCHLNVFYPDKLLVEHTNDNTRIKSQLLFCTVPVIILFHGMYRSFILAAPEV